MVKQRIKPGEENKKPELSGLAMKTPLNYSRRGSGRMCWSAFLHETNMDREYFVDHNNWISFEYAHTIFRKIVDLSGDENDLSGGRETYHQPGRGGEGCVDCHEGGRESFSGLQGHFRPCADLQSSRCLQDPLPVKESNGPRIPPQGRLLRAGQVHLSLQDRELCCRPDDLGTSTGQVQGNELQCRWRRGVHVRVHLAGEEIPCEPHGGIGPGGPSRTHLCESLLPGTRSGVLDDQHPSPSVWIPLRSALRSPQGVFGRTKKSTKNNRRLSRVRSPTSRTSIWNSRNPTRPWRQPTRN